jgi:hypothetical protein
MTFQEATNLKNTRVKAGFYCENPIPKANNLKVTIGAAELVS